MDVAEVGGMVTVNECKVVLNDNQFLIKVIERHRSPVIKWNSTVNFKLQFHYIYLQILKGKSKGVTNQVFTLNESIL